VKHDGATQAMRANLGENGITIASRFKSTPLAPSPSRRARHVILTKKFHKINNLSQPK
jgi:hypothetical protein